MKVMYGDKEGYIDGYLKDNLDLYKKMVKNHRDLVFVVTGKEREGKSVLANTILKYLDPTYCLDRCYMSGQEFVKGLDDATNFQALCYDEAAEYTARGSLTKFNRIINEALSRIGVKQLFMAICLPSFFELDRYPAIHRSNFLLRVYSHQGQRGFFEFWNWENKLQLYLKGKKFYDYSSQHPNFRGYFTKSAFPLNQEEYDAKKLAALKDLAGKFRQHDKEKEDRMRKKIMDELKKEKDEEEDIEE